MGLLDKCGRGVKEPWFLGLLAHVLSPGCCGRWATLPTRNVVQSTYMPLTVCQLMHVLRCGMAQASFKMDSPPNPTAPDMSADPHSPSPSKLSRVIFASRWLQLPLYLGLIAAQGVYVFHFWVELLHLLEAVFGSQTALQALIASVGYKADGVPTQLTEVIIMLVILGLIDVVMISNLLIMVIVGGYETFVSRMYLEQHPDQPEWLSHVNASVLKVKLAMAIIGISSIHLLKTFINAANYDEKVLLWQTIIHIAFLLSALAIAYTDKLLNQTRVIGHEADSHH